MKTENTENINIIHKMEQKESTSALMIFFWYFISCFCAVYKNTQLILIEDTLISFFTSMIYPFGLKLLPGMFRIPALLSNPKNKRKIFI